jgi:hypothetical protein
MGIKSRTYKDVFVVRYWNTRGILRVVEAEVTEYDSGSRAAYWGDFFASAHNNEFFYTYEDACLEVERLAKKRVTAFTKALAKTQDILNEAKIGEVATTKVDNQMDRMKRESK